ncbi:hypothetical protein [Coprococcus sp. AM100_B19A]|uniref:hypothetical protein n=1 Tax=Coprococcus sp. AM100_B19A TaxID=2997949 RepID=UPI002ED16D90
MKKINLLLHLENLLIKAVHGIHFTGEDELHIRQLLTDLDECADALLLREAAEVEDVILLLRFFPIHLVDEVVHF